MKKAKILIIDDEAELVYTLTERLNLRGYNTSGTTDYKEGLNLLKEKPDIVILDIGLPGIDGLEVLKKIKDIDSSVEVIILSGYGDDEKINKSLKYGAFDYLIKPVDIEELIAKIESAKLKKESGQ